MSLDLKNLGPLINTMVNPFAGQVKIPLIGGLTGDRYTPGWFRPSGAATPSSGDKLLFQAGALASTYAAAILALRYVSGRRYDEKEKKKMLRSAHSALNARRPILAVDPNLGDVAAEEKERMVGLEDLPRRLEASDAAKGRLVAMLALVRKEAQAGPDDIANQALNLEKWSLVVPIAAVIAGVYGADKIYQNLYTAKRKAEVDQDVEQTRNLLNQHLYDYMRESRGMPKTAAGEETPSVIHRMASWAAGTETPGSREGTFTPSGKAALWLAILGLFGVSALASKDYFDKRDDNRQRHKQLLNLTRRLATVSAPPVLIPPVSSKEYEALNAHLDRPERPPRPKQLPVPQTTLIPERTIAESVVDPTDELLSSALNQ